MDSDETRARVEAALRNLEGVASVEPNVHGQAAVEYDASEITVMDLIRTLRRIGFLAGME
jgi:copper chaperone CopZ